MTPISAEQIEQTEVWLSNIEEETEVESLLESLEREQPALFEYLLDMGGDDFDEDEREIFLFLGILIWKSMSLEADLLLLTAEALDEVHGQNLKMLEYLSDESESAFRQVSTQLMKDYPQPELLRCVTEWVADPEDDSVRPENRGIMLIFLKIVIDCFNQS